MDHDLVQRLRSVPLPAFVLDVLERTARAGGHAYVVGGAARNSAWGLPVLDWDMATDVSLATLVRWYGDGHPGFRFGTVRAHPRIEITVLREDGESQDHRHPIQVRGAGGIAEDLRRRDFTVNAVAFNRDGVWHVPEAGEDLRERRWRAVGDPARRFREDALRTVRLARLAMAYGGTLDRETVEAAKETLGLTRTVSRERRLGELYRMLAAPGQNWLPYQTLGLDFAYQRPDPEPVRWPRPFSRDARLLFWLREGFPDWREAERWLRAWPFSRQTLRDLIGAGRVLWKSDDPDEWVRAARMGEDGAGVLADFAAVGGAAPPWHPLKLALDAGTIARRFGLNGPELGRALHVLRQVVARDPAQNTAGALAALMRNGCAIKTR